MNQPPGGSPRPSVSTIVAGILILALGALVLVGALTSFQLPDPVTSQARDIERLYLVTLVIAFIIYFLVMAGFIWAIFRFRRRDNRIPQQIHGSNVLEFTWTIIPILILIALFIPSVLLVRDLKVQPSGDEVDLRVDVVGHQWWWEFQYPDQGITVQASPPDYNNLTPPALVVPVDATVVLSIRSTDVVHSFYAINTLYKIQAIPGNVNFMHFKVEKPGIYYGQCYQFCGLRHSDMLFVLDARPRDEYEAWVRETQRAQGVNVNSDGSLTLAGNE